MNDRDETETLRRLIADCVQSQFRYLSEPARLRINPHDFGERVASEVIGRLRAAGIEAISR